MKKIIFLTLIFTLFGCNKEITTLKTETISNFNSGNLSETGEVIINRNLTVSNSGIIQNKQKSLDEKKQELKNLLKQNSLSNSGETIINKTNSGSSSEPLTQEEIDIAQNATDENVDKLIDILFENNDF